ncbi:hypothetical protein PPTG_14615 [Phytophthora nicotianae INRA-310]|uniref:BZIP domain-containing protein n=1 Tax=Phytophthora nicotianae (strain INRA-310) TaxID=761204 RepID=W2PXW8_PHYN3|nr:hypothetical protein PPTG_14615 [Phytophthora nicotianae INRA-310]ETN04855.1 hypothetical protein PPTG_14615 [Phytophthora nicotianae INRA-310]
MDTWSLEPPNCQALSDTVIRDVLQRAWTPERHAIRDIEKKIASKSDQQPNPSETAVADTPKRFSSPKQHEPPAIASRNTNNLPGRKRSSKSLTTEEVMQLVAAQIKTTDLEAQPRYLANLAHASEALYKERRRLNQIRYRKKQQENMEHLEEDVQTLQQEIHRLTQRHQNAVIGISSPQSVWVVATEYFWLFQNGFKNPPEAMNTFALNFLCKSMAPDTKRLEKKVASNTLEVTTVISVTISKDTLRLVFPHLKHNEHDTANRKKLSILAAKMLNTRLVMDGSVLFEWDPSIDRVVWMQSVDTNVAFTG